MNTAPTSTATGTAAGTATLAGPDDPRVRHGYATHDRVRLHYAEAGEGPLLVLLHGFPEFWFSWRHQIPLLARTHHVVAPDLRGYNLSDHPAGAEHYGMDTLVADLGALIAHFGQTRAIVVGHDWGGAIAWSTAMARPDLVGALAVLNLPHPWGLARELATNEAQQAASAYAYRFQQPDAHHELTAAGLADWLPDQSQRAAYLEALGRSDLAAMLAYYQRNYPPRATAATPPSPPMPPPPPVTAPTLLVHGLDDYALLAGALDRTWEWVHAELTLLTLPGAGHFVHQDDPAGVNAALTAWLRRHG